MAEFKQIATFTMNAASNTSRSSASEVPTEFGGLAMLVPPTSGWCVTASCNIRILMSDSLAGTYVNIGYAANQERGSALLLGSTVSGWVLAETPNTAAISGGVVVFRDLHVTPRYMQLQFSRTATAAANFVLFGRKP